VETFGLDIWQPTKWGMLLDMVRPRRVMKTFFATSILSVAFGQVLP